MAYRKPAKLAQYKQACISPITWVDALVKAPPGMEDATCEVIDANFKCVELEEATLTESLNLRRIHCLTTPDALIWASARIHGWQLVTGNTKGFPPEWTRIRLPYAL